MNTNLLPKNLREKDLEEKALNIKQGKSFNIELSNPKKASIDNNLISSKPKVSFWKQVFGEPQKPIIASDLSFPSKSVSNIRGTNFLSKHDIKHSLVVPKIEFSKPVVQVEKNKIAVISSEGKKAIVSSNSLLQKNKKENSLWHWLNGLFIGKSKIKTVLTPVVAPQVPVVKIPAPHPFHVVAPKISLKALPELTKKINSTPVTKAMGDSWWGILSSLLIVKKQPKPVFTPPVMPKISLKTEAEVVKNPNNKPVTQIKRGSWRNIFHFLFANKRQPRILSQNIILIDGQEKNNKKDSVKEQIKKVEVPLFKKIESEQIKIDSEKPRNVPKPPKFHLVPRLSRQGVDVNLLPSKEEKSKKEYWQLVVLILVIIICAVLIYVSNRLIGYYQELDNQKIKSLNEQVALVNSKIKGLSNNQIPEAVTKLYYLQNIFGQHVKWSKFYQTLEYYTLDTVYYVGLSVDNSGVIILPAVATDYDEAAKQIEALRQATDFVKLAETKNISLHADPKAGFDGVTFDLKIILQDDFLIK